MTVPLLTYKSNTAFMNLLGWFFQGLLLNLAIIFLRYYLYKSLIYVEFLQTLATSEIVATRISNRTANTRFIQISFVLFPIFIFISRI